MAPPEGPSRSQTTSEIVGTASDAIFGTRSYTAGAKMQLPRKVPLRVEPKSFFANERTFLGWLSMATTVGGISTALAGYTNAVEKHTGKRSISQSTSQLITIFMLPLAMLMILYAMLTFYYRSKYMQQKEMGFYQDWYGPAILAGLIMICLLAILVLAAIDLANAGF
jgi:uncharacterized membrane protein YidH (DUF202 family)